LAYIVNFPRLSLTLAGGDVMEVEDAGQPGRVTLRCGAAIFVPANCWNRPLWSARAKVLTLLFGRRQTGVSLVHYLPGGSAPAVLKTHFNRPLEGPVPGILEALIDLAGQQRRAPVDNLLVTALLHCCLKLLEDPPAARGGKAEKTFQKICLYVQENFQFPLTRDSVAAHFRLSPNHISRLFRTEGLMKFNDYLTWVRLDRAKFLLRHHHLALKEVAANCGYHDTAYFCRTFKRKTKRTPTEYRVEGGGYLRVT